MKYDGQDCKLVQLKFIEFYGDFGKKNIGTNASVQVLN